MEQSKVCAAQNVLRIERNVEEREQEFTRGAPCATRLSQQRRKCPGKKSRSLRVRMARTARTRSADPVFFLFLARILLAAEASSFVLLTFMFGPDWKEAARAALSFPIISTPALCTWRRETSTCRRFAVAPLSADRSLQEATGHGAFHWFHRLPPTSITTTRCRHDQEYLREGRSSTYNY